MMLFGERATGAVQEADDYVEVEFRFFAAVGEETPVELRLSTGRDFPLTRVTIDHAALALLDSRPAEYGEALGRQLFEHTVLGTQFAELTAVLDARAERCRVRLRIDDPILERVRWERLYHPHAGRWVPIASAASRPFSRFVPSDWKASTPLVNRPVSLLLVHASPTGLDRVRLAPIPAAELAAIRDASRLREAIGEVSCTVLSSSTNDRPTLAQLRLRIAASPHIVHILCHGVRGADGSALVLENDDGSARTVTVNDLLDVLQGAATRPRLIVLSACESATQLGAESFVALGPALAASGVDAVLAMCGPVSIDTARRFCTQFYAGLFSHGVVDLAVSEARSAVRDALDWGVPVLFARMRDCQLLDFAAARVDTEYLSISDRTARSAMAARAAAERAHVSGSVLDATTALIDQLERSHRVLVGVCSDFRATGHDPATFAQRFTDFHVNFKRYADEKGWWQERTRCHELSGPAQAAMALFRDYLPATEFQQLSDDLNTLQSADGMIVQHLESFLNDMDVEVDAIGNLLQRDIAAAIARKEHFDDQISPTFRRSKSLLSDIAERSARVRVA